LGRALKGEVYPNSGRGGLPVGEKVHAITRIKVLWEGYRSCIRLIIFKRLNCVDLDLGLRRFSCALVYLVEADLRLVN
jgi:hypothetical protein